MSIKACLALGLLLAAIPGQAEEALWVAGIVQGPVSSRALGGRLVTWLEVQPRFAGSADTLILRPALGVQINPKVQLLLGYALIDAYPDMGARRREHRVWQQALVRLAGTPGKAVLMSRTRLEQRFVEGQDDDAMRLRQFFRGQYWLDTKWSVIGVSEAFIGLESTGWGQRAGLEQVRNFVGMGYGCTDRLTLEAGYLNQRLVRPGADGTNHVLNLNLFYRIG
jgi:hypothetical protein